MWSVKIPRDCAATIGLNTGKDAGLGLGYRKALRAREHRGPNLKPSFGSGRKRSFSSAMNVKTSLL